MSDLVFLYISLFLKVTTFKINRRNTHSKSIIYIQIKYRKFGNSIDKDFQMNEIGSSNFTKMSMQSSNQGKCNFYEKIVSKGIER